MIESGASLPAQIRVSLGTAILLGLLEGKMAVNPTTAYLMTHTEDKCSANCGFCPQAKNSKSRAEMLSRVNWPSFPTLTLITALNTAVKRGEIKRVCIQALNISNVFLDLEALVRKIKKSQDVCVSVSCQPLNSQNIQLLRDAGVERIGIALDAATEAIFCKVKGAEGGGVYSWNQELILLKEALSIFGAGKVSTHLIVGLGETEKEAVTLMQWCVNVGVLPALFAFTPVFGTALEKQSRPSVVVFRRLQLARYLLVCGMSCLENMSFDVTGKIVSFGVCSDSLEGIINSGKPFQTSGCPNCNRPFYNESPRGPLYNYPRILDIKERKEIKEQLGF